MTTNKARPGTRAGKKGPEISKHFPVYFTAEEEKFRE
jgi:hypothetical protein